MQKRPRLELSHTINQPPTTMNIERERLSQIADDMETEEQMKQTEKINMLNIVQWNVDGLGSRGRELRALIAETRPTIVVLNETKGNFTTGDERGVARGRDRGGTRHQKDIGLGTEIGGGAGNHARAPLRSTTRLQ